MADLPVLAAPTPPSPAPHIPVERPRGPLTRRRLMFFDRVKVLVLIGLYLFFAAAKHHADVALLSWGDVIREELKAKKWLLWIAAIEVARQAHYLLSERSGAYNQFWVKGVWGRWDEFWSRRNPWLRYRLLRMSKTAALVALGSILLGYLWNMSPWLALAESPARLWNIMWGPAQGMPLIIEIVFALAMNILVFAGIFFFMSRGGSDVLEPDEVRERFEDVKGQDRVLEKIKENIVFLEKPREIEGKGGYVPGGVLLYGPPGTGKTLMAKAVAGETGRPFMFVEPGAFLNMFWGVGILKVKSLFKKVRKLALRHGGVIVFFDEADVLGNRGARVAGGGNVNGAAALAHAGSCNGMHYLSGDAAARLRATWTAGPTPSGADDVTPAKGGFITRVMGMGMGGGDGTLQGILTEMSGMEKPRGFFTRRIRKFLNMPAKKPPKYRVLIMMATNAPDALDPALLRPGRIDRMYKVDLPKLEGRMATFDYYLDKIKHSITREQVRRLAVMAPNATGAIIKDMVNEALIEAMRTGRDTVEWQDMIRSKQLKTHGLPDEVHPMALERHAVALHEAGHAVAFKRLLKRLAIDMATIEPRGATGGFVNAVPLEELGFGWKSTEESDVMVSLASLATERHFYGGDNSLGVGQDMRVSTQIVANMLAYASSGSTLVSHGVPNVVDGDRWKTEFGDRVEATLQDLYRRTQELVERDEVLIMAVAHALELHKTISGEDIDAIFEGGTGPLVDGRWYKTPEFEAAYRRYHEDAVRAHQHQTKLATPLPLPPGVGADAVDEGTDALREPEPAPVGVVDGIPGVNGNGSNGHHDL